MSEPRTTSVAQLRQSAAPATANGGTQQAKKLSLLTAMAKNFSMEPQAFMAALKATVMRPDKQGNRATDAEIAAFLAVAQEYKLNPFTKQIHAFKDKDGTVIPVIGVDGWAELVNRHPAFDGVEFEYKDTDAGGPYAVTCIMYRKDRSRPIKITEFFDECFAHAKGRTFQNPWSTHPRRMLRHKAYVQAARMAFGFGGMMDEQDAIDAEFMELGGGAPAAVEFTPEHQAGETIDQHGEIHALEHQPANTVPAMEIPEDTAEAVPADTAPEPARAGNGISDPGFAFE